MRLRSFAVATIVSVLMAPACPLAAPPDLAPRAGDYVPGEVLVKFRPAATAQARADAVASLGHALVANLDATGWTHVTAAPGQSVAEAVAAYAGQPEVEHAQPNLVYRATAVPNDARYGMLWGFHNTRQTVTNAATQPAGSPIQYTTNNPGTLGADMNLEKAWDQITDCSSVVVAVVDTGVNYTHEDLAGNMWDGGVTFPNHGRNFVNSVSGDSNTLDRNGHGTHVAGTIGAAGNNSVGVAGVCWQASIMAVRVLDASGSGTTATIISGIQFAVDHGAKVINMSLGGGGGFDQAFSDEITAAQTADVLVVVAAGNDAANNDVTAVWPCNFTQPNLLCVAALDQAYQLASFSNWGATSVDVGAPGTNIVSTWPGEVLGDPLDGTVTWHGTTTTGATGGWGFAALNVNALVDSKTFPNGTYNNNTDDRVWRATPFNLTGASAAVLHFIFTVDLVGADTLRVASASSADTDPFAPGGTPLGFATGSFYPSPAQATIDVSTCGAACTIGFQLTSDGSFAGRGAAVGLLTMNRIDPSSTSYNTENGTSMATPATTGVATMLRAYNPRFKYADVVAALKGGGRPVAALAGKTTTGKAVDAIRSLAFLSAPTGLAAVVH